MPNHIHNIITLLGDQKRINQLRRDVAYEENEDYMETGEGTIDFKKIIPMPPSLDIEAGSTTDRSIRYYVNAINPETKDFGVDKVDASTFSKIVSLLANYHAFYANFKSALSENELNYLASSNPIELMMSTGKQAIENLLLYGAATWYEWCIQNWGTKWNSYDNESWRDDGFDFNTAWNAPHPVIIALSKRYPDVLICHKWADEDLGSNCGYREYLDGQLVCENTFDNEEEALKFACDVWDEDYDEIVRERAEW